MTTYLNGMMPDNFLTKVVGVSFCDDYPNNIHALAKNTDSMTEPCQLVRDKDNEHDENAIRVEINRSVIGHLPRLIAIILAPKMDRGEQWTACVDSIVISQQNTNKPGLKIKVWRQDDANV